MCTPREGGTPPRTHRQSRRIPGGAYPRESGEILSQRPTTHRPQHLRTGLPFGILLPPPHNHGARRRRRGHEAGTGGLRRGWSALWPLSRRSKAAQGRNVSIIAGATTSTGDRCGSRGRMGTSYRVRWQTGRRSAAPFTGRAPSKRGDLIPAGTPPGEFSEGRDPWRAPVEPSREGHRGRHRHRLAGKPGGEHN